MVKWYFYFKLCGDIKLLWRILTKKQNGFYATFFLPSIGFHIEKNVGEWAFGMGIDVVIFSFGFKILNAEGVKNEQYRRKNI